MFGPQTKCLEQNLSHCSNEGVVACSFTSVSRRFSGGCVRYCPTASTNLQAREIVESALQLKGFLESNSSDFKGEISSPQQFQTFSCRDCSTNRF